MYKYFKVFSVTQYVKFVSEWKSKGLSNESIKEISTSDNSLNPTLSYYDTRIRVKFTGGCLKQPKVSYTHGKVAISTLFTNLVHLSLTKMIPH